MLNRLRFKTISWFAEIPSIASNEINAMHLPMKKKENYIVFALFVEIVQANIRWESAIDHTLWIQRQLWQIWNFLRLSLIFEGRWLMHKIMNNDFLSIFRLKHRREILVRRFLNFKVLDHFLAALESFLSRKRENNFLNLSWLK